MSQENEILGYVVCRTCMTPKAIKQGSGKRAAFVHGRCECGPDNRTGKPAQAEMSAYKSLEEVQTDIEAIKANRLAKQAQSQSQSDSESDCQSKTNTIDNQKSESKPMGTAACMGLGAVFGLVFGGLIKTIKAVA